MKHDGNYSTKEYERKFCFFLNLQMHTKEQFPLAPSKRKKKETHLTSPIV